jgi:hypothetical protein
MGRASPERSELRIKRATRRHPVGHVKLIARLGIDVGAPADKSNAMEDVASPLGARPHNVGRVRHRRGVADWPTRRRLKLFQQRWIQTQRE